MTTIVDNLGRIVSKISGDAEAIRLNTPPNCIAVKDPPHDNMYYESGNWKEIPTSPKEGYVFDYTLREWVDTRSLNEIKELQWIKIKQLRDSLEFGGFEYKGNIYDSDQVSQGRIIGAANLGIDQVWTLADNSTVYLSSDELVDLYAALQEHISNLHERSRIAREKIENAQTIAEVESVTL